jgi:hypothetical protein
MNAHFISCVDTTGMTGEKETQSELKMLSMSPTLLLRKANIFTSLLYSRSRLLSLLGEIKFIVFIKEQLIYIFRRRIIMFIACSYISLARVEGENWKYRS